MGDSSDGDSAMQTAREVLAHLRSRQDEMVDLLRRLAEVETPSALPAVQAPVFDLLAEGFVQAGYRVRRRAGRVSGGQLLARPADRSSRGPCPLILGHCDTLWPVGTLETMPVRIEDGLMRGPGVFDMKGGLAQMVFALQALSDLNLKPAAAPVALINSDEELGSDESRGIISRLARMSCRALVLEPALGRGGKLKTARKGVGRFTITLYQDDRQGFGDGDTVLALAHVIQGLFALNDPRRGITVNVGMIEGGKAAGGTESRAQVDVRVPHSQAAVEVVDRIHAMAPPNEGVSIHIEGGLRRPPLEPTLRNRALWHTALALGRQIGLTLEEGTAGGGSDGNFASQFTATLDGLGAVGDGAHARHEHVVLDRMPERAALLALLLLAPL